VANQQNGTGRARWRWLVAARWRWLVAGLGAVLLLVAAGAVVGLVLNAGSGGRVLPGGGPPPPSASPSPTPSPTPEPGADITGPLNLLLVGIDPRVSQPAWRPNADTVMIMHVNRRLTRAYLFSLPRDLLVDVPAFEPAGSGATRTKLTHAMSIGSQVPGQGLPDREQGFALLSATVSRYTGIDQFDAGAVLNFGGFTDLVDAVGGIQDFYVDQRVVSLHREPDGTHRDLQPGGGGYVGPQKVYEVGEQDLAGWEALDYARQRYITGGDYARQRHQRQLVKALVRELFQAELVTDPAGQERVLQAVGDALVFVGHGQRVVDFAFALQQVGANRIELVELPGSSVFAGGSYLGEQLNPVADQFLAAVSGNRVARFLDNNPGLTG
jgi:anionic cell wall polymer biosynthesis LytR-Cps2A-Psr (LCP) family protein